MDTEEPLAGGHVAFVVRVGDTIRRPAGPWTPAVHGLLRHLDAVGFEAAPRVLGLDDKNREVLAYIEGDTLGEPPWPTWVWEDDLLEQIGRLLREYHAKVARFEPPAHARWRFSQRRPASGELVCHNDIGFHNAVFRGGRVVAFLDWDWAYPAPPAWDLAHAAWLCVPLMSLPDCARHGIADPTVGWQARRLKSLCMAYGLSEEVDILDLVRRRIQFSIDQILAAGTSDPEVASLAVFLPNLERDLEYIRQHATSLQ